PGCSGLARAAPCVQLPARSGSYATSAPGALRLVLAEALHGGVECRRPLGLALARPPAARADRDVVVGDRAPERPDRRPLPRDVREWVELVPPHGVLVGQLAHLVVGDHELVERGMELFGCRWPHRVAVGVVALPRDVVNADLVAEGDTGDVR